MVHLIDFVTSDQNRIVESWDSLVVGDLDEALFESELNLDVGFSVLEDVTEVAPIVFMIVNILIDLRILL